jgi:hypothetical protein
MIFEKRPLFLRLWRKRVGFTISALACWCSETYQSRRLTKFERTASLCRVLRLPTWSPYRTGEARFGRGRRFETRSFSPPPPRKITTTPFHLFIPSFSQPLSLTINNKTVLPIVRGWEAPDGGVLSLVNVTKRHAAAILNATTTSPNPIGTLLNETKKTVSGKEKYVQETVAVAFGRGNTTTLLKSVTLGAGPLPFDVTCVDPETGSLVGLQKAPAGTSLCGAYGNKVTVPTSKGFIPQIKVSRSKEKEGDGTKEQGRVERKSSRERTTTERLDQNGTSREACTVSLGKKNLLSLYCRRLRFAKFPLHLSHLPPSHAHTHTHTHI